MLNKILSFEIYVLGTMEKLVDSHLMKVIKLNINL